MANEQHLKHLRYGSKSWNKWREQNPDVRPDLSGIPFLADSGVLNLRRINFSNCDLSNSRFRYTDLRNADFKNSDLQFADLNHSNPLGADFTNCNLRGADLADTNLTFANFTDASLREADLWFAHFEETKLTKTNFNRASVGHASFNAVDLSSCKGLHNIKQLGPSSIGVDTIYLSGGNIPEEFLRKAGVPNAIIAFANSLVVADAPIQFYSCFISYSTKDEDFAKRLYSRMRDENLRVWFAPEDVRSGEKLRDQIDRAIQLHDRLLLVLSRHSLKSKWVEEEIRKARKVEQDERRRKLFPIRLLGIKQLQDWECFDSDSGEDLAREVRTYFIPDFSRWKDQDHFEEAFTRLLRDLRSEEK
jgi:hypothetical protein